MSLFFLLPFPHVFPGPKVLTRPYKIYPLLSSKFNSCFSSPSPHFIYTDLLAVPLEYRACSLSRCLDRIFPLPGTLYCQILCMANSFMPINFCSNVTYSRRSIPTTLFKIAACSPSSDTPKPSYSTFLFIFIYITYFLSPLL